MSPEEAIQIIHIDGVFDNYQAWIRVCTWSLLMNLFRDVIRSFLHTEMNPYESQSSTQHS